MIIAVKFKQLERRSLKKSGLQREFEFISYKLHIKVGSLAIALT